MSFFLLKQIRTIRLYMRRSSGGEQAAGSDPLPPS